MWEDGSSERLGDGARPSGGLSRRHFLGAAAAAGGTSLLRPRWVWAQDSRTDSGDGFWLVRHNDIARVMRREDLLTLTFRFYNLARARDDKDRPFGPLRRLNPNAPMFMSVEFPPQHVSEQAFLRADEGINDPYQWPARARLAGPTRLAFRIPNSMTTIPFTLAALLDWVPLTHNGVPAALPHGANPIAKPTLRAPRETGAIWDWNGPETAIEAPWRLMLSPSANETWAHASGAKTTDGWTEVWHSRLARRKFVYVPTPSGMKAKHVADEDAPRHVRAVWAAESTVGPETLGTMDKAQRKDIVTASADFTKGYVPQPVDVRRLMLSPLGAWLDLDTAWPARPEHYSIQSWRHRTVAGRDNYVRLVQRGYLMPFGHPAVFIEKTERQLDTHENTPGAFLRKRQFIVVLQPVLSYGGKDWMPHQGRGMPFTRVEVITRVSPSLAAETLGDDQLKLKYLVIQPGSRPFRFDLVGTDWDGRAVPFSLPLVFAPDTTVNNRSLSGIARAGVARRAYNDLPPNGPMRTATFEGRHISIAQSSQPGDTEVEVKTMSFGVSAPTSPPAALSLMAPQMDKAAVRLATVEAITGTAGDTKGTTIQYPAVHLNHPHGSAQNAGQVFAELAKAAPLRFASGQSGGVGVPDLDVTALSRSLGIASGPLDAIANNDFNPEQIFAGIGSAKLLGGITLKDVIAAGLGDAPRLVQELPTLPPAPPLPPMPDLPGPGQLPAPPAIPELPTVVDLRMEWAPKLKAGGPSVGEHKLFAPRKNASFLLESLTHTDIKHPEQSYTVVRGDLRNVDIHIGAPGLHVASIDLRRVAFESRNGAKPDFQVDVGKIEFAGPLRFVDELTKWISLGGDTFSIEAGPTGVKASTSLPIPNIQIGVFALSNLVFHGALELPFTGDPFSLEVGFSSRDNTFSLDIGGLGGGGFFAARFGSNGIQKIEGALEFGGQLAFSIPGLASGSVYIRAGIYFSYEADTDMTTLAGYLTMGGELRILGLVSVTVSFDLELAWVKHLKKNIVRGRATLVVEVSVLGFSESVELTVERSFGGDPNDPTFADQLEPAHWEAYCAAFSPIGVAA